MEAAAHPMRRWRAERGVTLSALSQRVTASGLKVTASHLSQIECGVKRPSLKLAQKLSEATADDGGAPAVGLQEIADAASAKGETA